MTIDDRTIVQAQIDRAPYEPALDPPEICDVCNEVDCECWDPDDWFAEDILADRERDADTSWADL